MKFISFGESAGHLAERVAQQPGATEIRESVFQLEQPTQGDKDDAFEEAVQILREAAEGRWTIEVFPWDMNGAFEPGQGGGIEGPAAEVRHHPADGGLLKIDDLLRGSQREWALISVDRVHIF